MNHKNVYIPISVIIKDTAWSFLNFVDSGVKKHQRESDQRSPDKPQQLNSVKDVLFFFFCEGYFLWLGYFLILDGIKMKPGSWLEEVVFHNFRSFKHLFTHYQSLQTIFVKVNHYRCISFSSLFLKHWKREWRSKMENKKSGHKIYDLIQLQDVISLEEKFNLEHKLHFLKKHNLALRHQMYWLQRMSVFTHLYRPCWLY